MTTTHTLLLPDEAATLRLGADLARALAPPVTFLLHGGLGAGKTTLVRGFVAALDAKARVKSPTYALAHSYETSPPVHHLDLYRLGDAEDAFELGLEHLLTDETAFCLVEWPRSVAPLLNPGAVVIEITLAEPGMTRSATFGGLPDEVFAQLSGNATRPDNNG